MSYGEPGQRPHQIAEHIAAHLEIAILIERGAGRREQYDWLRRRGGFRVVGRRSQRPLERAIILMRYLAAKRCGKLLRRLADQISLADSREELAQGLDPAGLGFAASDPENVIDTSESLRRRVRVRGLGIVDEENCSAAGG